MAERTVPGQDAERRRYAVYTPQQAATMCGVQKRAIREAAKRRIADGQFVGWAGDDPMNPTDDMLLTAEWVAAYAYAVRGVEGPLETPMVVALPAVGGAPEPLPEPPAGGEASLNEQVLARRLASAEQLADANKREATEVALASAEREVARAREEAERSRMEAADVRSQYEGEVLRLRRLVADQAEIIARQADTVARFTGRPEPAV